MNIQIDYTTFLSLKGRDKVPLLCLGCSGIFYKEKQRLVSKESSNARYDYCNIKCYSTTGQKTGKYVFCLTCGKTFYRKKALISSKMFCSQSCSATYNNSHKSYGIRRSNFEIYLEDCIRKEYPDINLICNSKEVIDSELDFYFPDHNLAIELNGIFHYEPIYGIDKFNKIVNNDKQKMIRCYEKGIELIVVDISSINYLTNKIKEVWWDKINSILKVILTK